jgi:hypothetical protein
VEEIRGWDLGVVRKLITGVGKFKQDYMITKVTLNVRREMITRTVPENIKLSDLAGDSVTD